MSDTVADVLIIGAGPSGGAAAKRFTDAGMSVVCLEQGEWPDRAAYRGGHLDWELTSRKQWFWDPNARRLPQDFTVDMSESDVPTLGTYSGVGGSATLFNGVWPRLTPANFRSRSLSGYGDDWPLTYDELLPYYEQTDREVGISGLGGNPAYPPGADPPLPPLPIQPGGLRLARAQARLGWHWWPDNNAILSAPYDGRNPCVQRATCNTGCSEGAKGTSDLTHWRHVVARGGVVITGARVTRIVLDSRGLAAGAEWCDPEGQLHFQRANLVVCAANAVGTARILLTSACSRFPDGLANGSGLLGRNLMFHLHGIVNAVFEEPMQSWRGHFGSWIGSCEFYESDESRGFVGCGKWSTGPTGGPLMQALPGPGAGVWGRAHHAHVAEHLGHGVFWAVIGEELASEENRVELSGTLTDSSGIPAPKIFYRIPDNTTNLLAFHNERASESLWEAGAVKVQVLPVGLSMSAHLLGDCPDGQRPGAFRGRSLGSVPRDPQPRDRRRQHLRHELGGEPHLHDRGSRGTNRGPPREPSGRPPDPGPVGDVRQLRPGEGVHLPRLGPRPRSSSPSTTASGRGSTSSPTS